MPSPGMYIRSKEIVKTEESSQTEEERERKKLYKREAGDQIPPILPPTAWVLALPACTRNNKTE
jgi:hypothetical protein